MDFLKHAGNVGNSNSAFLKHQSDNDGKMGGLDASAAPSDWPPGESWLSQQQSRSISEVQEYEPNLEGAENHPADQISGVTLPTTPSVQRKLSDMGIELFYEAVNTDSIEEKFTAEISKIRPDELAKTALNQDELAKTALNQLSQPKPLVRWDSDHKSERKLPMVSRPLHTSKSESSLNSLKIIPASDIAPGNRRIWVVTTASLPWLTGTAVNPLLRAAYLARERDPGRVTLMIPWLEVEDQLKIFPGGMTFETEEQQREYIVQWLDNNSKFGREARKLDLRFYPGRYQPAYGSIFPMGDILLLIPDEEADVCILEEPEHINWFRPSGLPWTEKFNYVIGIMHTNYELYARGETMGFFKEFCVKYLNIWMARAYCDRIIKLSATLQEYAPEKEVVCNVHGIRDAFLEIGDKASLQPFQKGAYFIGKMLWGKGYDLMIQLMSHAKKRMGSAFPIDIYGSGPDQKAIQKAFRQKKYPATFYPAQDHATLTNYKVFINPSVSEVLCTTTAEALGMGKFTIIPDHPSNTFFKQFQNCLMYKTKDEFCANVYWALSHTPEPVSPEDRYTLTWEAATERLIRSASTTVALQSRKKDKLDEWCIWSHKMLGEGKRGDIVRSMLGGGSVACQNEFMEKKMDKYLNKEEIAPATTSGQTQS